MEETLMMGREKYWPLYFETKKDKSKNHLKDYML